MLYYSIFFLFFGMLNFFGGSNILGQKKNTKFICFMSALLIALLIGLRHYSVGTDTISYVGDFRHKNIAYNNLFELLLLREPLYIISLCLLQWLTDSYSIFLLYFAMPISCGFSMLLKKYSEDIFLSVLIFACLGVLFFSMAGLRQSAAIGFTMMALPYAIAHKPKPFLLLCLIAFLFHYSAVTFLFVYWIVKLKPRWYFWLFVAIAMLLGLTRNVGVLAFGNYFLIDKEYHLPDTGLNYTMFFIQCLFLIFAWLYGKNNEKAYPFFAMAFAGIILQAFTPVLGEFFRASLYFSSALTILVPMTLEKIEDKQSKNIIYLGIVAVCMSYIFFISKSAADYRIFFD